MSSQLSGIDPQKRRQVAATLGLFSVLFIAVGAVAATGADTAIVKVFVAIALVVALLLALMAWGVARSITLDRAEADHRKLDTLLEEAAAAHAAGTCGCGHDHTPPVVDTAAEDPCAHDGHGAACAHDCDTCVLATLRRPMPRKRPMPSR